MNHDTLRRVALVVCVTALLPACAPRATTKTPNQKPDFSLAIAKSPTPSASDSSQAPPPSGTPTSTGPAPSTRVSTSAPPSSRPTSRPTTSPALPFESEIRAFEEADARHFPASGAVVFVGSSTIRLWKTLAADFHDLPVLNRGFGGSQVADSVRYADRIVLPYRPRAVVLYAGDNDLAAGKSPEQVAADVRAFAVKVHAAQPDVPILFLSIKPSVARWHLIDKIRKANALVEQFAIEDDHVDYVDTFTPTLSKDGAARPDLLQSDGLHLNAEGYKLWTPIVREHLDRALAAPHI